MNYEIKVFVPVSRSFCFCDEVGVASDAMSISYQELCVSECFCGVVNLYFHFDSSLPLTPHQGGLYMSRRACTQSERAGPHCRCYHEES